VAFLREQERAKGDSVAFTSVAYDEMAPRWAMIETVMGGTRAMRAAGETYLPRHPYETVENYNERLSRAVLDNYTLRTLETLVGKAWRDPPSFNDDVPQKILDLMPNMDGRGHSALTVLRTYFRTSVAKAVSYLWVDFSTVDPEPNGMPRTLADDAKDNLRPFWKLVPPERVLFQQGITEDGEFKLTQVRMYEPTMEPNGNYGEQLVERIRVLRSAADGEDLGTWEVWVLQATTKNGAKKKWVLEDSGPYGLPYIPLVAYHTDETGLGEGKPPMEDLADLNVEHWQSKSDQRNILTVARFPMLAVSGAATPQEGDKPLVVGPNTWLSTSDAQGKFYYVEHTGAAISSGRDDIQDLEKRMTSYGAEFMKEQADRASATGRQLDSSEAVSLLKCWCFDFKDAVGLALKFTADWLKIPDGKGGTVEFELEPDIDNADQFELATLTAMRARGDISREGFIEELMRRGMLPDDYDAATDLLRIQDEPLLGGALGGMFGKPPAQSAQGLPGTPTTKPKRPPADKGTGAAGDQ
jgi:hypothetical protein